MIKSYGANRMSQAKSRKDYHLEEFQNMGYTILENVLSPEETLLLKNELDRVYSVQEQDFGKDNLRAINEEFLARALLVYSEPFLELARKPEIMEYISEILGNYFVLHLQNGIINMPKEEHHQSSWHRDLPYQNWVSSESIGCNVFYCIDPFTEENGATIILPFSHKIPYLPSEVYLEKHGIQIKAPAGSAVLFDSMLFHKAGYNRSDQIRRGVNILYARAIIGQQIDLPAALEGRCSDDPFLNMLLGYGNRPAQNVGSFRALRKDKSKK